MEGFANWISLRGGHLQQVKVILAHLAPEAVAGYERVLMEIAHGTG